MKSSKFKTYAIITLAVAAVVVVLQNTQSVETRVLFFTFRMPRVLLLVLNLLVGFFVGVMVARPKPAKTEEKQKSG
jgi:uncharacterized integral membrane protein